MDKINLLITAFDRTDTRMADLSVIFDVGRRPFDSIKLDIYQRFRKWIDVRKPHYSICKILWLRPEKENIEWKIFGPGFTATDNKLYTTVYYSNEKEIIPEEYVK